MKIVRESTYSGIVHEKEIAITQEQLDRWNSGEYIQNVAPELSPDDREFILTGITREEWDEMFKRKTKCI